MPMEPSSQHHAITAEAARQELTGGYPERALDIATRGIKQAPKDRRYLLVAAEACAKLGRHADRIGYLRTIVKLHPDDVRNWFQLAATISRAEGPQKAADQIRRAYEQRPPDGL